jgi:hypothetical protein
MENCRRTVRDRRAALGQGESLTIVQDDGGADVRPAHV